LIGPEGDFSPEGKFNLQIKRENLSCLTWKGVGFETVELAGLVRCRSNSRVINSLKFFSFKKVLLKLRAKVFANISLNFREGT